jgi:hypothetical protein
MSYRNPVVGWFFEMVTAYAPFRLYVTGTVPSRPLLTNRKNQKRHLT